jgi:hypothetical protein
MLWFFVSAECSVWFVCLRALSVTAYCTELAMVAWSVWKGLKMTWEAAVVAGCEVLSAVWLKHWGRPRRSQYNRSWSLCMKQRTRRLEEWVPLCEAKQKYVEQQKISWTDRVRCEVLHRVKKERNILHTVNRRKANWIGHILCRNCLLKHVIEGKVEGRIEVTGRRGWISKQLLDDVKERRGYCKLKEEAVDRTVWRTGYGRGCGPVVRQTAEWMRASAIQDWCGCRTEILTVCVA